MIKGQNFSPINGKMFYNGQIIDIGELFYKNI